MTLSTLIHAIELVASRQPDVQMIVENDIFRLNEKADARYGVFGWTQGQHSGTVGSSLMNYTFTFFYVDRLTENKANQVQIQSVGIATLDNIIRTLDANGIGADTYNFTTFNQRFLDECAGVFVNVTLSVPVGSLCPEDFILSGDYNNDFNSDFLIY